MKIAELFAKDPCRRIDPIIRADERDPELLGHELEEYVVTPEIDRYLRDILGQFIESRPGRRPEGVCAWISGWFGSGKSHFLKFLGAILSELPLKLPSGAEVGATSYLCRKWNLPFEPHLGELKTRVVFINLLGYVRRDTPGLSEIVYRGLMSDSGYADEPWVAEMERFLSQRGLYDRFKQEVERAAGLPWSEVRRQPVAALPFMARALVAVDPNTWPSVEQAERDVERQREIRLDPNRLVPLLKSEAELIDKKTGRLVVLLDEVGLYIADQQDRYLELKAIAEKLAAADVYGKVWLVVTSQEAPEVKIQAVIAKREELAWLQDRFPLKFALTPENIETVVRERLLKKTEQGAASIRTSAERAIGALTLGAGLVGVRRNREVFEPTDAEKLAETYPFLPYHVRLTTEALGQLRGRGGVGGEGLTGRERAILSIAQSATCSGASPLADGELGPLVTFEHIFNAIVGDTKAVPAEHEHQIRELAQLGSQNGVSVQAVAKALYLLQQVPEWVPASAENVAAVLYPRLGARGEEIAAGVRSGLATLIEQRYVGEREGTFRFLLPVERTFEEDVQRARRDLTAAQRRRLASEILRELLSDYTKHRFRGGIRVLDVQVEADGEPVSAKGYLKLIVRSPLASEPTNADEIERAASPVQRDTLWFLTEPSAELAELIERVLAMESVLNRPQVGGPEGIEFRREREREKETLRHTTLPARVRELLARGILISVGARTALKPEDWESAIRTAMEDRAEETFYEFQPGAAVVKDEDVGRILTWRGGTLPDCYRSLQVVEDSAIREDGPLLSRVVAEVKRQPAEASVKGPYLVDHFDRPPYGWDERVVRLALATLFRHGSVEIRTPNGVFRSYADAQAGRLLTNRPAFRDASFSPTQVLTNDQRKEVSELVAEWFETLREAPDEIDQALCNGLRRYADEADKVAVRLGDFQLGGGPVLRALSARAREVLDVATPTSRLLAVLEPTTRAQLTAGLALLKRLREWDAAKGFERAAEIRGFLAVAAGADDPVIARVRALLASEDLPKVWAELYATYRAAIASYVAAYTNAHSDLAQRVEAIVSELRTDPAVAIVDTDFADLARLACAENPPNVAPPLFRCPACRRALSDLQRDALAASEKRTQILRKLQAQKLVESPTGTAEPFEATASINSPEQLDPLVAGLQAYAERALKEGSLQVEITARRETREV